MLSYTEENYLKAIYRLSDGGLKAVLTNEIAETLKTKAASVTDMIKRLSAKGVISYEKYHGVNISHKGKAVALEVIRKHRLWETFLVEKLNFNWDEVHEVAEQLEHIQSPLLIEKLDVFLGHPKVDPHGHPIPDKNGKIQDVKQVPLSVFTKEKKGIVRSVQDASPTFLQHLSKIGVHIGASIIILEKVDFDGSLEVVIDNRKRVFISRQASENLLIAEQNEI